MGCLAARVCVQDEPRGDGTAGSPSTDDNDGGAGWATRVKGWFSSVRFLCLVSVCCACAVCPRAIVALSIGWGKHCDQPITINIIYFAFINKKTNNLESKPC